MTIAIDTDKAVQALIEGLEPRIIAKFYGGQIACVVAVVGALKLFGVF